MFIVIYTAIWLGVTIVTGLLGFMIGKLPILDNSPLPWVMCRDYRPAPRPPEPDHADRWPARDPWGPDQSRAA
jgi:hypothetical protein